MRLLRAPRLQMTQGALAAGWKQPSLGSGGLCWRSCGARDRTAVSWQPRQAELSWGLIATSGPGRPLLPALLTGPREP